MQAQNAKTNWIEQHPLLFAFGISVIVNVILFFFGERLLSMGGLKNPDLLQHLAQSPERIIELTSLDVNNPMLKAPDEIKIKPEQQMPMLFIEVDPSKAVQEAPENTKFYAAQSTLASNPDSKIDSELPKIDGKQTKITRAFDAERTKPKPIPVLPSPPPQAKIEAQPNTEPMDKPHQLAMQQVKGEFSKQKQNPAEEMKKEPGDLDQKIPAQNPPQESQPEIKPVPRPRPASLAEAKLREGSNISPGEKMKLEGGVADISRDFSFAAKGTPLGEYEARMIDAIRNKWYALLEDRPGRPHGHVTIEFYLYPNGAVRNVKITEQDVGELYSYLCQSAVSSPAPYEKWPADVRAAIGAEYHYIRFNFYYQ